MKVARKLRWSGVSTYPSHPCPPAAKRFPRHLAFPRSLRRSGVMICSRFRASAILRSIPSISALRAGIVEPEIARRTHERAGDGFGACQGALLFRHQRSVPKMEESCAANWLVYSLNLPVQFHHVRGRHPNSQRFKSLRRRSAKSLIQRHQIFISLFLFNILELRNPITNPHRDFCRGFDSRNTIAVPLFGTIARPALHRSD